MILRFLAALALVCLPAIAHAQTGSVKTPAQLNTEINTNFPDQTQGAITPFDLRQVTLDQVASVPFLNSTNAFTGSNSFSSTVNFTGTFQLNGSALGTGVPAALTNNLNAASGLVGFSGALGTPLSGTLTNATGLPISTGLVGLGTGVAAALANNLNVSGGIPSPTLTRAGDIIYWNGSNYVTLAGNNSGTQVLQETSSGVPSWATVSGTGTVTSVTCGTGLSGGTFTTSGTCALALTNTTLQASPGNPTGTSSTVGVMMGLGTTCHLTPAYSGRIHVEFYGTTTNSTSGQSSINKIYFGTGTAPSNAAATTGTQIGNSQAFTATPGTANGPVALGGLITGLTPGTAYWFDINLAASANTASDTTLSCNAFEF